MSYSSKIIRNFFFVILIPSLFVSCKKEEADVPVKDYIRFKLNGVPYEYTVDVYAKFHTPDNMYGLGITGYKNALDLSENLGMEIFSNEKIASGKTYRDPLKATSDQGSKLPQLTLFHNSKTDTYMSAGLLSDENGVILNSDVIPSLKKIVADAAVTITEITSTHVKGKFSGTVYASPIQDGNANYITEGEFVADIK